MLTRRTPMKRTPFKSKAPNWLPRDERPRAPLQPIRVPAPTAAIFRPIPKFDYVRSEAMRLACRALPCQCCGISDGTIVWAHSNWAIHGHGRGIKASDEYVSSLCHACHRELDQGSTLTESARQSLWWLAHVKTVAGLLALGLWPVGVPVPDTSTYPEQWIPLD